MTYFGFLIRFVGVPIVLLLAVALWDRRRGRARMASLRGWPVWAGILLHMVVALVYTTPWDNYLVATGVWWYDPGLVTGITLGWVPIEEYTFFVVQPLLAGLWLVFVARRFGGTGGAHEGSVAEGALKAWNGFRGLRRALWLLVALGVVWLAAALALLLGVRPATYLALELVWALPPIGLQLAFGADILWRQRRVVLAALVPLTLYLSAADALAIGWGTWTIDPAQSFHILIGGVLPLEEFVFFLLTNTLLTFGIVLVWAEESQGRMIALKERLRRDSRRRDDRLRAG